MSRLLLVLALGMVGLAGWRLLQPPQLLAPQTSAAFLARMDTDGSGDVSEAEYARVSDGIVGFATFDTDGSGALEVWEVEQLLFRISPDVPQPALLPRVQ